MYETADLGGLQCLPHRSVIDFLVRHPEGDIAANGIVHHIHVLGNIADFALPGGGVILYVATVCQNPSRTWNEETEHQIHAQRLLNAAIATAAVYHFLTN